jgi:zinc transport system ATP-binding protein
MNEGRKMKTALEVDHLTVMYDHLIALNNVSFSVAEGDFVAIVGPNGGGKSTLIKAILNLVPVAAGNIRIFGEDYHKAKGFVGYVPQQSAFDSQFPITVKDVVKMGRLPSSLGFFHRFTNEDDEKVHAIMKELKIEALADRPIGELSGGQKQKVLLARALVTDPKLLILDEPTANLDPPSRKQIYELLQEINKKITILMISHDDEHLLHYASSIVYINKKVIYQGSEMKSFDMIMTTV